MIGGTLHMTQSGRWAVCRSGKSPIEIASGEVFRVEVDGKMRTTRMEFEGGGRGYHSVDGTQKRNASRALASLTTPKRSAQRAACQPPDVLV